MAVVGAAMVAAWSVGAGVATADESTTGVTSSCEDLLLAVTSSDEGADVDPCDDPASDGGLCDLIPPLAAEGVETTEGDVASEDPCSVEVTVGVEGDCEDPESFTFTVDATGLAPETTYEIFLTSDDVTALPDDATPQETSFEFTTDADGAVANAKHTSTEGDFDFPAGAFALTYAVVEKDLGLLSYIGQTEVGECETTQPGEETPAPAPAPSPSDPGTTAPVVVAPVVVTQPAAGQPAVLANTGTPVTSAALLGGGLLVAGAGALVASRRRTN